MRLILGSSSPFRRTLLEKIYTSFSWQSPEIDETPLLNEAPTALVQRLSLAKAKKIAETEKNALIIGSDQVATFQNQIIGKPYTHEKAVQQLSSFSNQAVTFYTGLCLLNTETNHYQLTVEPFSVQFKKLNQEKIERYLTIEKPYQCAGSFKSEGLGICLFERLMGDDPNSLIGLPLIKLIAMLENEGVEIP
jgi:MAF protein